MNNIFVLDCTLRDGGYVNDWNFGKNEISAIKSGLENSGVDILELGFMRDEILDDNRTIFPSIEAANALLGEKQEGIIYSTMIEAFNPFSLEKLSPWTKAGTNLIRICIWKRCMDEHMAYCKAVADKGYKITIQPSRVEQYNKNEFIDMLKRSNELHPYAVYVVDTWGTQSSTQICKYLELADTYLDEGIKVGYHGHNNKLQALCCAQAALNMNLTRDLCIDSSIMGMGRGAGNLNTEIIMDYLNENHNKHFDINQIIKLFNTCLKQTYKKDPWGYSMYYYLSSTYGCNPNYATYFSDKKYGEDKFQALLNSMTEKEKTVFNIAFVEERLETMGLK
jgi:4-hydroxy 2-oxovalerate aldolase